MPETEGLSLETWDTIPQSIQMHAARLGTALAVLIIGWALALIISSIVKKMIQKTGLSASFEQMLFGERPAQPIAFDILISRLIFYFLMFFVFVGFFQALELTMVTEPMQAFLNTIFQRVPNLIGPAILIVVAWIVATILRLFVLKVLGGEKLGNRLASWAGWEPHLQKSAILTLANVVYWAVLLIFSLAVLDALHLQALLDPLKEMFEQILSFLPNMLAAALIFAVGWFFARIVRRVTTTLLDSLGTDRLGQRMGIHATVGQKGLSGALGTVAYVLVLIPVITASLNALRLQSITSPISELLSKMLAVLPHLFAAALVMAITYFVGRLLCDLITAALTSSGFNMVVVKLGLGKDPNDYQSTLGKMGIGEAPYKGSRTPSQIVGYILFVVLLLFAGIEALGLVGFESLADLLTRFVVFLGQILLGLIIFGVALFIANLVARTILATQSTQAHLLATVARVAILVLAGAMALQQMGLAEHIINLAFGIVLGAVALAVAIAFGLGGREVAADLLKQFVREFRKRTDGPPDA